MPREKMRLLLMQTGCLAALASFELRKIPTGVRSAVCNDGSAYAYYVHTGASNNWVIFQNGGSYCYDEASCNYRRSHHSNLMTSNGLAASIDLASGILSNDAPENPYYATWNKVDLLYCTSDAFSGTVEQAPWTTSKLSFLGSRVIPAVIADLTQNYGLVDSPSTTVIYSGASAGAVGMYGNMDLLSSTLLPAARVVAVVDSGWFLNSIPFQPMNCTDNPLTCTVEENLAKGTAAWNSSVDAGCASATPVLSDQWQCLLGDYVEPYLSTPTFVFQWQYDLAQLYHDGITDHPSVWSSEALAYAQSSKANLTRTFSAAKRHHQFFSASCYHHVALNNKSPWWLDVTVRNITLSDSLNDFVTGKTSSSILLDECLSPDCNPTCPPPL
jgi:hypothetical protein